MIIIIIIFLVIYKINNNPDKNIELVIARYNENLNWLNNKPFSNYKYTIYNKGTNNNFTKTDKLKEIIKLKNIGRGDHTYLYHIINNYDNLAEITIFLPGSVDLIKKYIVTLYIIYNVEISKNTFFYLNLFFLNIYDKFKDFKIDEWQATNINNKLLNNESKLTLSKIRPFGKWYKHHFGNMKVNKISIYSIFAVHKRHILQHPKSYYENLIKELEVSSNPEVGHYYERAWAAVFSPLT